MYDDSKTLLRNKLEFIEEEILQSWLKDTDKTSELLSLNELIIFLLDCENLEEFFENQSDLDYFLRKFSKETINNILRQTFVYGENGDDIALKVLWGYVKLWLKFSEKIQYLPLWESVREIFDPTKPYFKVVQYHSKLKIENPKKILTATKFNETLPKNPLTYKDFSPGDAVDILIDNKQGRSPVDNKAWIRGRIKTQDEDYYQVLVADEDIYYNVPRNTLNLVQAGLMTKDHEWRTSLKEWDVVDCYDRGKWYPATIVQASHDNINGIACATYTFGFRLYIDQFDDWRNYTKYWHDDIVISDYSGKKYIGDHSGLDEDLPHFSKRIQKFNSMLNSTGYKKLIDDFDSPFFVDDFYLFLKDDQKNYIIGRGSQFCYYYACLLKLFARYSGYEKILKMIESRPCQDTIYTIFLIFASSFDYLHKDFMKSIVDSLTKSTIAYIKEITANDMRNVKKDAFEMMLKVLTNFNTCKDIQDTSLIEELAISTSFRMLKTSIFDKRLQAVKTLADYARINRHDKTKAQSFMKMIDEYGIIYEIFGLNTHTQLVTKGKELVEYMLFADRLSEKEVELIWSGTQKGDLEGKLTILKLLKEVSGYLQPKHIKILLNNIYANITDDLIAEEIDLVYELSTKNNNESDIEKCITFFTKCLLHSKTAEGGKIQSLINKIFEIAKIHQKCKINVVNICIDSLENNVNTILSLKVISKVLNEANMSLIFAMNDTNNNITHTYDNDSLFTEEEITNSLNVQFLFKDNYIVKLFCDNFRAYKHCALEYIQKSGLIKSTDLGEMIKVDGFSHVLHIKARIEFMQMLQSLSIGFDDIEFLYEMLHENPVCEWDKQEFYGYILKTLNVSSTRGVEKKIFEIFAQRICGGESNSCQLLSIQAFEAFMKIFLDINMQSNHLFYSHALFREKKKNLNLKVFIPPDKLIGFDILWKIVFESFSPDIMSKGIETLHTLYTSTSITSNECNSHPDDYSEILLTKCIDMIKDLSSNNSYHIDEKKNKISKCLKFLTLIIEESEKKGTARIKSHSGLLKRKVYTIKISSMIGRQNDFSVRVYGNTTMFELKEIVSKKADMGVDFLKILIKSHELSPNDNGKTVIEMNIADYEEIIIALNDINNSLPQAEFFINEAVNPALEKIFSQWFTQFSVDEKMTRENLARFITEVTCRKDPVSEDDNQVLLIFRDYDTVNNGYITRKDFVSFYLESARDRPRVLWENLYSMGIRNDLKNFNEPLETVNMDKTLLPRYQLAHNEELFDILFSLQDLHESIAKEAFQFICSLTTNPKIFKEILSNSQASLKESENIYKLIYSLQIIESFIEDIEIDSVNIDSFIDEETILGDEGGSLDAMKKRKIEWIHQFIQGGAFKQLIEIINKRLGSTNNNDIGVMDKMCLELLIKIIKIFFNSSLSRFEHYRAVEHIFKKNVPTQKKNQEKTTEDNMNNDCATYTDDEWEDFKKDKEKVNNEMPNTQLKKAGSFVIDTKLLNELFQGELGDIILTSIDYPLLVNNLMTIMINLCKINPCDLGLEEKNIIENAFEFLIGVITFSPDNEIITQIMTQKTTFQQIFRFGIVNENPSIREKFGSSLIKFAKISELLQKYEMIIFLFLDCMEIFEYLSTYDTNSQNQMIKNTSEYFEFFSLLFEMFFTNTANSEIFFKEVHKKNFNPSDFALKIAGNINQTVNDMSVSQLSNEMLVGYLKLVTKAVENSYEIKKEINDKYGLIELILCRILFKQNSKELTEKLLKMEYICPEKIDDQSTRSCNIQVREVCYGFISAMLKDSLENFEKFFSLNLVEEKEREETKFHNAGESTAWKKYYQSLYGKKEGHVGIRNLGCICYMNSIMQQLFMVPTFRYAILQANDHQDPAYPTGEPYDDNLLHQLQHMYTFLDLSSREDYNPQGFCFSFKDSNGRPTSTCIQQDSQEFLNSFCDKIENCLKSTQFKYIINSVFVGRTCSQVICDACGKVSNRFEDFYNLTLEVANMKTLHDSLEKFIAPEKIDEFLCENCTKKVTITKRTSLADLPNVMIVHLKRFFMNYEHERTEKINSRLEFPRVLNMKKYCIEEIMKASNGNYETEEIYLKKNEYYEYHLVGVNVHMGSADGGHYFSYINTIRNGKDNEVAYDPTNVKHSTSWLKFNDSTISKFNVGNLDEECYGGSMYNDDMNTHHNLGNYKTMDNIQNAYLLIYERREKTPIKIVVSEPDKRESTANVISFKAEEGGRIKKSYDISRVITRDGNEEEVDMSKINLKSTYFYDSAKNEYYQQYPFFGLERYIPRNYYLEVTEDNTIFQKQQNIQDENFNKFFENTINILDETIRNMKNIKPETSERICVALLPFAFKILNSKSKQKIFLPSVTILTHFLRLNENCLEIILNYVLKHFRSGVTETLINEDSSVVSEYSKLFIELITHGLVNHLETPSYTLCDGIYRLFPRIETKYVNKIYPVYEIFKTMINVKDYFVEYFFNNKAITVFLTFLLGRQSPCISQFSDRTYWDANRINELTNIDTLIEVIELLVKRSAQYNMNQYIEEGKKIYRDLPMLSFNDDDIRCFKSLACMEMIYKVKDSLFSDLMILFQTCDAEFTVSACEELINSLEKISLYEESKLIKLINAIMPILTIQDEYQLIRFQMVLGYPMVIIEDPNANTNWPLFGYNKLANGNSKWLRYYTKNHASPTSSILGKLSSLKEKRKLALDVFYIIFSSCITNIGLLKYLWHTPAEEAKFRNIFEWGFEAINEYSQLYSTTDYDEKFNELLPVFKDAQELTEDDSCILPGFKGYVNNYMPYKIKREEITHICKGEDLVLLRFEYYTSIITRNQEIDYSKSAQNSPEETTETRDLDESQNSMTDSDTFVMDISERTGSERDFVKKIIPIFGHYKRVIVQDSSYIEHPLSTIIRYVIYSSIYYI